MAWAKRALSSHWCHDVSSSHTKVLCTRVGGSLNKKESCVPHSTSLSRSLSPSPSACIALTSSVPYSFFYETVKDDAQIWTNAHCNVYFIQSSCHRTWIECEWKKSRIQCTLCNFDISVDININLSLSLFRFLKCMVYVCALCLSSESVFPEQ